MYQIVADQDIIRIYSDVASIEIFPEGGAILNRWDCSANGEIISIVHGYDNMDDFRKHCESKGFRSCKLSPYVCRMRHSRYSFEGKNFRIGKFELSGNAIHGLLYDVPFEVIATELQSEAATVVLQHQYKGADAGFPFPYRITVTYSLHHQQSLSLSTTVENSGGAPMPLADGWHPYFNLGRQVDYLEFSMASDTMLVFDQTLLPTGALEPFTVFTKPRLLGNIDLDNCFLLQKPLNGPACTLTNPANGLRLEVTPDEAYPYLQLYIPPDRQSIAIENLSAAPDAFNNKMGLIILDPGESISFTTEYTVSVSQPG